MATGAPHPRHPGVAGRFLLAHPWWAAAGAAVIALALLVAFWDWNWFKPLVERTVSARTGRTFDIGGDLEVEDLGWTPTVSLHRVRFGNAAWSKVPDMATAELLRFRVELKPLLFRRETRIPEVVLRRPHLRLEVGPDGTGNWRFGTPSERPADIGALRIASGELVVLDPREGTDFTLAVRSDEAAGHGRAPILATGGGHWKHRALRIEGRAESPLALRERTRPYRIDVHATAGDTRAHARGTLLDPLHLRGFDLRLDLRGRNLAELYPLLGIATPDTPPYRFDGRLTRDRKAARTTWHYTGFDGRVGDSDLRGEAHFTVGGTARPFLRATLASRRLDLDDLAGFVNKAPASGPGETSSPALAARAARERASTRVLPDTPYALDKLRAMDADVRWKASRIEAPGLPLDDMEAHLLMDGGQVRLDPLDFGVAGGTIRSVVRMDARRSPIRTRVDMSARGLHLARLLPQVAQAKDAIGRVGGNVHLAGNGNSIARMLGSADGDAALGMGRGEISNLLMEYAGLDIAEALKFMIEGDRRIPVRCAFGDFAVKDGVMSARALAFDTTDTLVVGEGTISLRDETFDLRLRPRPKDRSLLVFRAPLLLTGSFRDPSFRPDMKRVGLRGAIALALGSIAPPAALLATLELGPGEDAQCGGRYAK